MRWAAVLLAAAVPAAAQDVVSAQGAVLRGLDKVSGETSDIELRVGDTTTFGRLQVSLADCRYPQGDPSSNAYAQLIIFDPSQDDAVFNGWMIAASPALSALDHPRYDVWVLRCMVPEAASVPPEESEDSSDTGEGG